MIEAKLIEKESFSNCPDIYMWCTKRINENSIVKINFINFP